MVEAFKVCETDGRDAVLWKSKDGNYGPKFVASETWHQIRQSKEKVNWSKLVWFSQGIPRYAFITWLAIRDRHSTGRRTSSWGQPQSCIFCMEPDETRDHIYFACPYTFMVWLKVTWNLFGLEPDPDWDITMTRLRTSSYDRLTFILLRLVFQVSVYLIWRERNERKHNTSYKSVDQLAKVINKTVRNRITSLKYACNPRLRSLMIRWFEAHDTTT